jgi:OmpA-like transmembrane domain
MNLKNTVICAMCSSVALGLLPANSAYAQSVGPFYIGGAVGASLAVGNYKGQVQGAGAPGNGLAFTNASRDSGSEFGGRIYAGYRFNSMFGAELGYSKLGSHDVKYTLTTPQPGTPFTAIGTHKVDGTTLDFVATSAFNDQISINGRIGVMYTNLRYSEIRPEIINGTVRSSTTTFSAPTERQLRPHIGIGAAYAINKQVALTIDWQYVLRVGNAFAWNDTGNGRLSYNLATVGARFSF